MKVSFVQRAGRGEVFSPGVFDSQVGKTIPFQVEGRDTTTACILKAAVSDDGRSVEITVEVQDTAGITPSSVSLADVMDSGESGEPHYHPGCQLLRPHGRHWILVGGAFGALQEAYCPGDPNLVRRLT